MTGEPFPKPREDGNALRADDWELLREVCEGDEALFDLQVALLGVEQRFRGMTRRVGVIDALEKCLKAALFENEKEAVEVLTERDRRLKTLKDRDDQAEDERRQLVLFREDLTGQRNSPAAWADPNDPGTPDAAEFLPLPRPADLRPRPRRPRRGTRGCGRSSCSAGRTGPARRRCSTRSSSPSTARAPLLEAGQPRVRRVPPPVDPPRRRAGAKGRASRSRSAMPRAAKSIVYEVCRSWTRAGREGPRGPPRASRTACRTAGTPSTGASSSRSSSRSRSRSSSSSTPRRSARSPRTRPAARCSGRRSSRSSASTSSSG